MSTTSAHSTSSTTTQPSRTPVLAALALALSAVLTAVGTFWDLTGNEETKNTEVGAYLAVLGVAAVGCALVFGLVVRGADRGQPGRRSAILGVVGVVTLAVFWTGLPAILAFGAIATALTERDVVGRFGRGAKIGLGLALVTLAGAVAAAIAG